jgi:hypothetical protein
MASAIRSAGLQAGFLRPRPLNNTAAARLEGAANARTLPSRAKWEALAAGPGFGTPLRLGSAVRFQLSRSAFIRVAIPVFFIQQRLPMQRLAPRVALPLERLIGVSLQPSGYSPQMMLEKLLEVWIGMLGWHACM